MNPVFTPKQLYVIFVTLAIIAGVSAIAAASCLAIPEAAAFFGIFSGLCGLIAVAAILDDK